jgi:molybdopterin synthase sulfur carrier subunit
MPIIKIHYFASVRERLNQSEEQLTLPEGVTSIEDLIKHLQIINPSFKSVMDSSKKILVAVNQTVIVDLNYELSEDDEVAFFPPMTGG